MTGAAPACIGRVRKNEAAMIRSTLASSRSRATSTFVNASFIVAPSSVTTFTYIWSHHTPLVFTVKKARPFSIARDRVRMADDALGAHHRCSGMSIGSTQALPMAPPQNRDRARVTCVVNQKGGVGKTTTAVNLAASVAAAEKRTLLVDMDPQGNASSGCGVRPGTRERTIYDVLIGAVPMADVLVETEVPRLVVAPATQDLVAVEIELVDDPKRALKLKQALAPILSRFDHVFIDCPPSLGLLTVNALAAADAVLVPLQCEEAR